MSYAEALQEMGDFQATLEQLGLGDYIEVDLRIVRGLAYYTGIVFEIFDRDRLDLTLNVEDEEAFEMTRHLAHTEGLFVGMSSGAAMAAALQAAHGELLREGVAGMGDILTGTIAAVGNNGQGVVGVNWNANQYLASDASYTIWAGTDLADVQNQIDTAGTPVEVSVTGAEKPCI